MLELGGSEGALYSTEIEESLHARVAVWWGGRRASGSVVVACTGGAARQRPLRARPSVQPRHAGSEVLSDGAGLGFAVARGDRASVPRGKRRFLVGKRGRGGGVTA